MARRKAPGVSSRLRGEIAKEPAGKAIAGARGVE